MSQIGLPLIWPADEDERDFHLTDANAAVARHLAHWSLWPVCATILTGPRKSGRSLIGRIFAYQRGGTLIDDAERRPEEEIFHAWNRAQAVRRPLLIVADAAPPSWQVTLPDLRSRLAATPRVAIEEPDEALAGLLLEKLLGRRGLALAPEVRAYLLRRIERSYVAIDRLVEALDQAALSRRSRITVPIARAALGMMGVIDDSP